MWPFQWKVLSCATVYCAVQVGSVLLVSLQVKTTLGCDHSSEKCWEELSFGAVTNGIRISNIVIFFIFFIYTQVVPILLHLVKAISSVRLYIPKDLRSLDSRQSVGKSIKVSTYIYDQIEIFRNQVVTVFLRYHTFAPCYSSWLGNPGNFCVCNPECWKLFLVESRIQVPLTRSHNPLPGIPNSQHGIKNLITLSGAIIYLFIYLFNADRK